jgi:hypothetical protein
VNVGDKVDSTCFAINPDNKTRSIPSEYNLSTTKLTSMPTVND